MESAWSVEHGRTGLREDREMAEEKLTQKDVTEWCKNHSCTEANCEYMSGYCHITEYLIDECQYCDRGHCKGCKL